MGLKDGTRLDFTLDVCCRKKAQKLLSKAAKIDAYLRHGNAPRDIEIRCIEWVVESKSTFDISTTSQAYLPFNWLC